MKQSRNKRQRGWFVKTRGSYLPSSLIGWLTYVPYLGYLVGSLVAVFREHYGFVTSVLILIPNWIAAVAVMNWIAANHSR